MRSKWLLSENMNVLKQPSLNTCEQGGISYAKLDPSVKSKFFYTNSLPCPGWGSFFLGDQVPVVAARSFIRGATVIFLFNVCLLCFGFLIYKYVRTLEDKKRVEIGNWICSLTGVVIMIVMHGLGVNWHHDLNSNFNLQTTLSTGCVTEQSPLLLHLDSLFSLQIYVLKYLSGMTLS